MTFRKFTTISGHKVDGEHVTISRPGHWKQGSSAAAACNARVVGPIKICHHVFDESGNGRSGQIRELGAVVPSTPMNDGSMA